MTVGHKRIGFTFSVAAPTQVRVTPIRQNVLNPFDFSGDLVSTKRLDGETNAEYKQRLMDVSVHPGGPLYEGIVNNLSREFGYERSRAILIDLKTSSSGSPIADSPRVDMLANRVILYSDWRPDGTATIDKEIYIYSPDDAGYFLEDLVTEINSSVCFSATQYSGIRGNLHSTNLIRRTSDNMIIGEPIEANNVTTLAGSYITKDSLNFDDLTIFDTEVTSAPSSSAEYYIDYVNGKVYPYDIPSGTSLVSYHYGEFPMQVDFSLVKIYTLQDDNFTEELFTQETLDSGDTTNALPNTEGAEILHQLYKETKVFWGE